MKGETPFSTASSAINRQVHEALAPTRQDIIQKFEYGFEGLIENPVSLDDLLERILSRRWWETGRRRVRASFKRVNPGMGSVGDSAT
jgi:hypothetical protein